MKYKDEILKIEHYKDKIIKDLIKKGMPPNDEIINSRVKNIDTFLSIYKNIKASSKEKFKTKDYNQEINNICKDLEFLYILLYELTVREYESLYSFTESNLRELEGMAKTHFLRSRIETETSFLGKTVLFKDSQFLEVTKDSDTYISLGEIQLRKGSRIAWLIDSDIDKSKTLLILKKDGELLYIGENSFISDTYKMPGNKIIEQYVYSMDDSQSVQNGFEILISETTISTEKDYKIYGGQNELTLIEGNGIISSIKKNSEGFEISSEKSGIIEFYISNSSYINFGFSKAPARKSFEGISIEKPLTIQKVNIEIEHGLDLIIETNGEIFATEERGIVKENRLYYPRRTAARDFLILEEKKGEYESYDAVVKIFDDPELREIRSIVIKEIEE